MTNTTGFAVIDFETTGLWPERHHRVIELAVVHVDATGRIEGSWDTLVNPERDLGSQGLHGVRRAEVMSAPTFADVAGKLVGLLAGRVVVAHNAAFELRFLTAELQRLGVQSPVEADDALCTMRLARQFLPGGGRSLADCCAAFDIDLATAHEALADATATAHLLSAYLHQDARLAAWGEHAVRASAAVWPTLSPSDAPWATRARYERHTRTFLERTMGKLPDFESLPQTDHREVQYLGMLDQTLADGFLSAHEASELSEYAAELGIDPFARDILHRRYFGNLVAVAWADGTLTDAERADIVAVARVLEIPTRVVASAIQPPVLTGRHEGGRTDAMLSLIQNAAPQLNRGDMVVLTGEMTKPRTFYERALSDLGLVAGEAVTKKARLLVAADVASTSGKARKARDYGIPIVSEQQLMGVLAA